MNLRYPNAAVGVKKIFTAEIMTLISTIVIAVSSIVGILIGYKGITEESGKVILFDGIAVVVLDIIAGIFLVIAFIKHMVGLGKAGKDNTSYTTALSLVIFKIVLQVAAVFVKQMEFGVWGQILAGLYNLIHLLVIFFVIEATCELADDIGRDDIVSKGSGSLTAIMILYIIIIILNIAPAFFTHQLAEIILIIAVVVLSLIAYIFYLSLLGSAAKALAQAEVPEE